MEVGAYGTFAAYDNTALSLRRQFGVGGRYGIFLSRVFAIEANGDYTVTFSPPGDQQVMINTILFINRDAEVIARWAQAAKSGGAVALVQVNQRIRSVRMYDYLTESRLEATIREHIEIGELVLQGRLSSALDAPLDVHVGIDYERMSERRRGRTVPCAPERMDTPITSTSSSSAASTGPTRQPCGNGWASRPADRLTSPSARSMTSS